MRGVVVGGVAVGAASSGVDEVDAGVEVETEAEADDGVFRAAFGFGTPAVGLSRTRFLPD